MESQKSQYDYALTMDKHKYDTRHAIPFHCLCIDQEILGGGEKSVDIKTC